MAAGNQGPNRGQSPRDQGGRPGQNDANRGNGGAPPAPGQGFAQNVSQGMEHVSNRIQESYGQAREGVQHGYRRAEGAIARNPSSSVLIGFGLGFGLGLALTALAAEREEDTWADRYLPDSVRDLPHRLQKLKASAPAQAREAGDSLHDAFSSLSASIRDLPAAIARVIPGR